MTPFPPPRILLPADACNSPMFKCNIHLFTLRPSPSESLCGSHTSPTSSGTPRDGLRTQFMHLVRLRAFIARAHGLYRLVSIMSAVFGAEERVTMRTGRPKIGRRRHACMRTWPGVERAKPRDYQVFRCEYPAGDRDDIVTTARRAVGARRSSSSRRRTGIHRGILPDRKKEKAYRVAIATIRYTNANSVG